MKNDLCDAQIAIYFKRFSNSDRNLFDADHEEIIPHLLWVIFPKAPTK